MEIDNNDIDESTELNIENDSKDVEKSQVIDSNLEEEKDKNNDCAFQMEESMEIDLANVIESIKEDDIDTKVKENDPKDEVLEEINKILDPDEDISSNAEIGDSTKDSELNDKENTDISSGTEEDNVDHVEEIEEDVPMIKDTQLDLNLNENNDIKGIKIVLVWFYFASSEY